MEIYLMYCMQPTIVFKIKEAVHLLVKLDDWYNDCQKGNYSMVFLEARN